MLYIWKFLYHKYCICSSVTSYFELLDTGTSYVCSQRIDLESCKPDFSERIECKYNKYFQKDPAGKSGTERGLVQNMGENTDDIEGGSRSVLS